MRIHFHSHGHFQEEKRCNKIQNNIIIIIDQQIIYREQRLKSEGNACLLVALLDIEIIDES
jgi:hypothetical protein